MTTTVLIGTQGSKNVKVKYPDGEMLMKPGYWITLTIRGDQKVEIQEHGKFVIVDSPLAPMCTPERPPSKT